MNSMHARFLATPRLRTTCTLILSVLLCTSLTGCLDDFNNLPKSNDDVSLSDATTLDADAIDSSNDVDNLDASDTSDVSETCAHRCDNGQYCFDNKCHTPPMLALGTSHSCALSENVIKCWGYNYSGQLGTNDADTNEKSATPAKVEIDQPPILLYAGGIHTCAITKQDGSPNEVYCWGAHNALEPIPGNDNVFDPAPSKLPKIGDVDSNAATPVQLALSNSHTCALLHNSVGRVRCWGNNFYGQLGNGDGPKSHSTTPVTAINISRASQVVTGSDFTCSLHEIENNVYCWGISDYGQLGHRPASGISTKTPQLVPTLKDVATLEAGSSHACAIFNDRTMKCWGANRNGQLGTGLTTNIYEPITQQTPLTGVKQLALGKAFTCALLDTGKIYCSGSNVSGQLGLEPNKPQSSNTFVLNPNLKNVHQIAAGNDHLCAVHDDNQLSCWGFNEFYQIGSSLLTTSATPVRITL